MKIGVLGSGIVGETLANGFLKYGHQVMRGSRAPEKLSSWVAKAGNKASIGTFQETAQFGELLVLAVKGTAAEVVISMIDPVFLNGKTILDTTNPIADVAPVNGILQYFTGLNESLMERLQKRVPQAHFVKAFNSVGNALMVNPNFPNQRPTMFICGANPKSKEIAREILNHFGWDVEDMGTTEAARAIEPLCILWCIPGFLHNSWTHAFKLLKP